MPVSRAPATQAILDELCRINGLAAETLLYRETLRDALVPADTPGAYRLAANAHPAETVVDVYGGGRVVPAEDLGPGLTFAMSWAHNWQETMELRVAFAAGGSPLDRVGVKVRVADLLAQDGLIYPVHSVAAARAWYCTLPAGWVEVQEVR